MQQVFMRLKIAKADLVECDEEGRDEKGMTK